MRHLDGFGELAGHYDGFILDIWGVIHDGVSPYPGAIDALQRLRAAGKRVVLLSNAPRRAAAADAGMRAIGIPAGLHQGIMTSGEATHALLAARTHPAFAALGRHVWHLGPERDRNLLEGLDLIEVARPAAASFVLNTGPDDARDPTDIAPFEADLAEAAAAGLPMVCANPDLEVIRGGRRIICAGALAMRYRALGGSVVDVGKPDPLIYQPVLEMLGLPVSRILAVGDSLRTDMAGAASIGADAAWVLSGIHEGGDAAAQAASAGLSPAFLLDRFAW
jgi:HAD superfamily hydrolase (TIGR01459 family)